MSVTAAIITYNEASNIEECLKSVQWADEIVVVDSGSSDPTVEKAKALGAHTYVIPFRDFASQKNAALGYSKGDWIFILDADERVTDELAAEIQAIVSASKDDYVFQVKRITSFFKKRLRFSGTQQDWPVRLFPRGRAYFTQPVHEKIVTDLPLRKLKSSLLHLSTQDYDHYQLKLKRYLPLELEMLQRRAPSLNRWHKFFWPIAKFALLYFWQKGICDGLTGLQFALLAAYYDFLKIDGFLKIKNRMLDPALVPK